MPITSPVDCMPGPTEGSTPRSLAVEKAGALTATNGGGGSSPPSQPSSVERGAQRDPDRELDHRHAGDLRHERHRPRRARVDLDQVDAVVADDELGVDQAAGTEGEHDPLHRRHDEVLVALADGLRREDADAVTGVHAGPLDVLEQPGDQHALAVADGVDVDLDALEVAVDADGPVGVDDRGERQLALQVLRRIAEVDGEPADHERRADDDRVADPLRERQCLVDAVGHAAVRLRDAEPVEQRREPDALLRLVDRLEVRAQSGTPPAASGAARLSGVCPPNATTAGSARPRRR